MGVRESWRNRLLAMAFSIAEFRISSPPIPSPYERAFDLGLSASKSMPANCIRRQRKMER
jgi:hypothetical protein